MMKYVHPIALCLLFAALLWAIVAHSDHLYWLVLVTLLEGLACLHHYEQRKL